ncbi:MAG: amidohydrolase [Pseudomonadota bacterium]
MTDISNRLWQIVFVSLVTLISAIASPVGAQNDGVDTIILNGEIITLDPLKPTVSAIAIKDGIIVATGDDASIRKRAGKETAVIDVEGRTVIPGLNDSHLHITRGGRFYNTELRWEGLSSLKRGLGMIAEQAARTPEGQWVRVIGGWSPYQFEERRMPTPAELTEAAPDTPVFVLFLYSQGFLNRAGVEALGITEETPPPEGGRYEITPDGGAILHAEPNPTILYKTIGALPGLTEDEQENSTKQFYRELNRFGITSAIDAGGGGHTFPQNYIGAERLAAAEQTPIRVSNYLFPQTPGKELKAFKTWTDEWPVNANLAKRLSHGFVVEGGGEFLVWSAGDFENWMAKRPDITTREGWREQLISVTRYLVQKRWPIRIHATYDQSIGHIMDVFEEVHQSEREAGRPGFDGIRWAIDHAETVGAENLRRIAALGGGIAIQARMAYAGEFFIERYGKEAAAAAPPIRDMIEAGIPVGAGTDATRVAGYNPWPAIAWLVTGETVGGTKTRNDRHQLTRMEALQLYTVGSAWFSGEEALKGRIAPGQFADIAVLSADYLTVPHAEISTIESVLTLTAGKVVHGAGPFADRAPSLPPAEPAWSPVRAFRTYE